mgnify:FL=1
MPDLQIDASKPVMVTGATGYVAGWLIRRLVEEGLTVHATVRDPGDEAKRAHLDAMAAAAPGTIRYFKADLLDADAFDAPLQGCSTAFHTASPFVTTVDDPQRDLVDPAVKGTRHVLQAANRCEGLQRVVLTSSCAAIYGDNADVAETRARCLTEDVWNTSSSLDHQPYSYSKTQAERAAWEIAGGQDRWRLVVVNPSLVVGPSTNDKPTSESFDLMKTIAGGAMKSGAPHWEIGAVDVRDVAEAHLRAAFVPEAEGRHVTSAENTSFIGIAEHLRAERGPDPRLPSKTLPKWLVWLTGPMINPTLTRKVVARNVGRPFCADASKSKAALGLTYRPLGPGLAEMRDQLVAAGRIKA